MNFQHSEKLLSPSVLLVNLKGVLDAGTAIELEMALSSFLKDPSVKHVILEVPDLTFISSSGLRVMMIIIKALTPKRGRLFMVGAADQILGLVKMSGMGKWINLRNSVQECGA